MCTQVASKGPKAQTGGVLALAIWQLEELRLREVKDFVDCHPGSNSQVRLKNKLIYPFPGHPI